MVSCVRAVIFFTLVSVQQVGMDIQSYTLWNDYIHFLRNVEAVGSYAENQRITAVRKVYQRGVVTPMLNIEQLWKDYIAYESAINPMIAEKMQQVCLYRILFSFSSESSGIMPYARFLLYRNVVGIT